MPERLSPHQRSRLMSRIHSKDTKCELKLRSALTAAGLKGYRLNYKKLVGTPDMVFTKRKIAIFCDSDFWHGKKGLPDTNQSYWKEKLKKNAERDLLVNKTLQEQGWLILRFSEREILKNTDSCVQQIQNAIIKSTNPR